MLSCNSVIKDLFTEGDGAFTAGEATRLFRGLVETVCSGCFSSDSALPTGPFELIAVVIRVGLVEGEATLRGASPRGATLGCEERFVGDCI